MYSSVLSKTLKNIKVEINPFWTLAPHTIHVYLHRTYLLDFSILLRVQIPRYILHRRNLHDFRMIWCTSFLIHLKNHNQE